MSWARGADRIWCRSDGTHAVSSLVRHYTYGGFLKWGYPQIIHLNGMFHYIHFGVPPFMRTPTKNTQSLTCPQVGTGSAHEVLCQGTFGWLYGHRGASSDGRCWVGCPVVPERPWNATSCGSPGPCELDVHDGDDSVDGSLGLNLKLDFFDANPGLVPIVYELGGGTLPQMFMNWVWSDAWPCSHGSEDWDLWFGCSAVFHSFDYQHNETNPLYTTQGAAY